MRRKTSLVICTLILLAVYGLSRHPVFSQAVNSCGILSINGNSNPNTAPIGGIVAVGIAIPTSTATQPVSRIVVRVNGNDIGRAQPNSSNYSWQMPWVTSLHTNGPFSVDAVVSYSDSTPSCITSVLPINIANSTQTGLTASANPTTWQGPMSFSFPVSVQVAVPSLSDATLYSIFQWGTTIGNINPSFNQAQFSSGQTVGNGNISILVKYGGGTANVTIPVSVKSPDAPLPTPSPTTTVASPTTVADTTSTTPESITRVATLQNNPVVQNCTISALGDVRFKAINSGETRPSLDEIKKFTSCFASSNYILPSNFSPVAPTAVKDLPKADNLQMNKPQNVSRQDTNGKAVGLKFGGKTAPNSVILLYIFSDPLVLTTTADKDGNWTYTLEDPIESGKHEVYTVVDRGDGVYQRSSPVSFFLGTATAAAGNPNGLSLSLAEQPTPSQSNRSLVVYATGAVGIVAIVLIALYLVIKRRGKKIAASTLLPDSQVSLVSEAEEGVISSTEVSETVQPETTAVSEPAGVEIQTEEQLSGESQPEVEPSKNEATETPAVVAVDDMEQLDSKL